MFKVLIVLSLAIIAIMIACGGGSSSRMTVEEYASTCKELINRIEDTDSLATAFSGIDVIAEEMKRWNPPAELQEFHDTRVESLETVVDTLKDMAFFELLEELENASEDEDPEKILELMGDIMKLEDELSGVEDKMAEMEQELERTEASLSPATRQTLADADCL